MNHTLYDVVLFRDGPINEKVAAPSLVKFRRFARQWILTVLLLVKGDILHLLLQMCIARQTASAHVLNAHLGRDKTVLKV